MRIPARGISDFVSASYAVPQNPVTDGMGDFVPGRFAVPQTPVGMNGRGLADFVGGAFSVPQTPVGLAALVPNAPLYPIPQNSVIADFDANGISYSGGLYGLGCGGSCSGGCSSAKCGGSCGMGTLSTDWANFVSSIEAGNLSNAFTVNLPAMLQDPLIGGVPVWAAVVGGALILYLGGTKKRWR